MNVITFLRPFMFTLFFVVPSIILGQCPVVASVTVPSATITTTSAIVNWSSVTQAGSYLVDYYPIVPNGTSFTIRTITPDPTGTTTTLTGLTPNQEYRVRVSSRCGLTLSNNVGVNFTTTANPVQACDPLPSVSISNITEYSATATWNSMGAVNTVYYDIAITNANGYYFPILSNSTTYPIDNLQANTTYTIQVRVLCLASPPNYSANDKFSTYATAQFTTLPHVIDPIAACKEPTGVTIQNLSTASTRVTWNAVQGAQSYIIEHKRVFDGVWSSATSTTNSVDLNYTAGSNAANRSVRVYAVCQGNARSNPSEVLHFQELATCRHPTGVLNTVTTSTTAKIDWIASPDAASGYVIFYNPENISNVRSVVRTNAQNTTSATLNNLLPNTLYEYSIGTQCPTGTTQDAFFQGRFMTTAATCSAPTQLAALNLTQTMARLEWASVPDAAQGYTLEYKAISSTGNFIPINTSNTFVNLSNLIPNTFYTARVTAKCLAGLTATSFAIDFKTPIGCPTPSPPTIVFVTQNSANISWNTVPEAQSTNSYWVEYHTFTANGTITGSTGFFSNTPNAIIRNLLPDTEYGTSVQTICSSTSSSPLTVQTRFRTSLVPCTLAAITPTITSLEGYKVQLSWIAQSGAVRYKVEYRLGNTGDWTSITTTQTTYTVVNVLAGAAYGYRVTGICANGLSGESTTTTQMTDCPSVLFVDVHNIRETSADVRWDAVEGARYNVSMNGALVGAQIIGNAFSFDNLLPDNSYTVSIGVECNERSGVSIASTSFKTLKSVVPMPCLAPTVFISHLDARSATISWSPIPTAFAYSVAWRKEGGDWNTSKVMGKSFDLSGLEPSTFTKLSTYEVSVASICSESSTSQPNSIGFTTKSACPQPNAPTVNYVSHNLATISWDAVNEASGGYWVEHHTFNATGQIENSTGFRVNTSNAVIRGLNPSTRYGVRINSYCDQEAISFLSDEIQFRTADLVCGAPSIKIFNIAPNSAFVSWKASQLVPNFEVQYKKSIDNDWITVPTTIKAIHLLGLMPEMTYNVRVRSVCSATMFGLSETSSFTTTSLAFSLISNGLNTTQGYHSVKTDAFDMVVSPNPSPGEVNLGIQTMTEMEADLSVVNRLGQIVLHKKVSFVKGENSQTLNLTQLPNDLYFIKIFNSAAIKTARVIIEK